MQPHDEYIREIEDACKRDVEAEYDRFKAISIFALIAGGIFVAAAAGLNWIFSWKIDMRFGIVLVFGWCAPSFFGTLWRAEKLRLRALFKSQLGWSIQELRADLMEKLAEIESKLSAIRAGLDGRG